MRSKIKYFLFFTVFLQGIVYSGSDTSSYSPEKYYNFVRQDYFGLNDEYETPYFIFKGKKSGPVMILDGGIHGDEIASYMACDSIVKYIKLKKGTLIVIPRTNIKACIQNTREVNFDFNHAFPGDLTSDTYEYRLAYEFMWLVDSVKPDIIINLHEARTKWSPKALTDPEKAYGQIIISCLQPFEEILVRSVDNMNKKIPAGDFTFHTHYYSFRDHSSLDNFVSKFNIKSYTVETYRGFAIEDRVKLQLIAALQFMEEIELEFEFPDVKMN
ncbi:MAG: succinylglutamate desuccinylase/aspartoacylase family protein [Ignavibacteria bacterium]|nr:succinylglutamate desuccinylase/aspartoacylase family protein [Ignavibacteria bacterium]MCC7157994.1 succinylglutamate desuccinylase/aspartoacylase family protein [Ignavibacteria bacterium]